MRQRSFWADRSNDAARSPRWRFAFGGEPVREVTVSRYYLANRMMLASQSIMAIERQKDGMKPSFCLTIFECIKVCNHHFCCYSEQLYFAVNTLTTLLCGNNSIF